MAEDAIMPEQQSEQQTCRNYRIKPAFHLEFQCRPKHNQSLEASHQVPQCNAESITEYQKTDNAVPIADRKKTAPGIVHQMIDEIESVGPQKKYQEFSNCFFTACGGNGTVGRIKKIACDNEEDGNRRPEQRLECEFIERTDVDRDHKESAHNFQAVDRRNPPPDLIL